jgi:hypothetical protein
VEGPGPKTSDDGSSGGVIHESHSMTFIPGEAGQMCRRCHLCECHDKESLVTKCTVVIPE